MESVIDDEVSTVSKPKPATENKARPEKPRSISPTLLDTKLCYEAQFFGFTPMSFSDGIYNALLLYSWELLERAQLVIKKEFPEKLTSADINAASQDIISKLIKSFERAFDKLELYIVSHIFRIPNHVVLPEDQIQEQYPNAPEDLQAIEGDIVELRQKIIQAKIVNANLKQELADVAVVQAELDKTLEYVKGVSKIISPEQCESLNYVCTKALQLKRLIERIDEVNKAKAKKPRIDSTAGAASTDSSMEIS